MKTISNVIMIAIAVFFAAPVFAQGEAMSADTGKMLAMGLFLAASFFGGTSAQGKAATAALEGIARNPGAGDKVFTPMLLSLAFIESLVIFSIVAIFLV